MEDRDLLWLDFELKLGLISEAYKCPSIRFLEKIKFLGKLNTSKDIFSGDLFYVMYQA